MEGDTERARHGDKMTYALVFVALYFSILGSWFLVLYALLSTLGLLLHKEF